MTVTSRKGCTESGVRRTSHFFSGAALRFGLVAFCGGAPMLALDRLRAQAAFDDRPCYPQQVDEVGAVDSCCDPAVRQAAVDVRDEVEAGGVEGPGARVVGIPQRRDEGDRFFTAHEG